MVIENWSLAIERHDPNGSIAFYKSSIFNSQSPSKMGFLGATSVMFESRLTIRTYFWASPYARKFISESCMTMAPLSKAAW